MRNRDINSAELERRLGEHATFLAEQQGRLSGKPTQPIERKGSADQFRLRLLDEAREVDRLVQKLTDVKPSPEAPQAPAAPEAPEPAKARTAAQCSARTRRARSCECTWSSICP